MWCALIPKAPSIVSAKRDAKEMVTIVQVKCLFPCQGNHLISSPIISIAIFSFFIISLMFQILTSVKKEHITALPMLNVPTPMDPSTVSVISKVISNMFYLLLIRVIFFSENR